MCSCEHRLPALPSLRQGQTPELRTHQPPSKFVLCFCDAEAMAFSEQCGHLLLSQPRTSHHLLQLTITRLVHTCPTCSAVKNVVVNHRMWKGVISLSCEHIETQKTKETGQETVFKVKCDVLYPFSENLSGLLYHSSLLRAQKNALNLMLTDAQGKTYLWLFWRRHSNFYKSNNECKLVTGYLWK